MKYIHIIVSLSSISIIVYWFLPWEEVVSAGQPRQTARISCFASASTRFAVIGDFGEASPGAEDVAAMVNGWSPDYIIALGDVNYEKGKAKTIDRNVGKYYSRFIAPYTGKYGPGADKNLFFPALGNHDWESIKCHGDACHGPYFDYFTLPGNERYYSIVQGPIEFFAINSVRHEPDGYTSDSAQARWLQERLTTSTAAWKIVFMHHPPYSSGSKHGSELAMRWPYHEWGADAVMSGHEHVYERLSVNNVSYFINGLGGKSRHGFKNTPLPESQVRYNEQFGAMLVSANTQKITFQFITINQEVIDKITLTTPEQLQVDAPLPTYTNFVYLPSVAHQYGEGC